MSSGAGEGLVTTNPRVWTGGGLVVFLICGTGCAREGDDENCGGPALTGTFFSGSFEAPVSRSQVGGDGRGHDEP